MEHQTNSRRGGRRAGAGRPKTSGRLYAFRADADMAAYIDSHANKTEFLHRCIGLARQAENDTRAALEHLGEAVPATEVQPLRLPFFDIKIVAGFPIPLDNDQMSQQVELLRLVCPNPEASYLVRVRGDSMQDAGIFDGDIIIVDKSNRRPSEHEVAVCELNGEYTVKRVVQRDGRGWLVPANPKYPDIEICPGDDFSVWGTVSYVIHKPHV